MKRTVFFVALTVLTAAVFGEESAARSLNCVKGHVEGNGTYNPQIVLANGCRDVVFWTICINYPTKVDNEYYNGTLQPGEEAWIETYPEVGEKFTFRTHYQTMSPDVEYPSC